MEALTAADSAARAERQVGIAQQRLHVLLGLRGDHLNFSAEPSRLLVEPPAEEKDLVDAALSSRPDLRAAEMAIEAAGKHAGWERSRILAFVAPLLSTKGVGTSGIKSGPGVSVEIPLFNRNQGSISRAEAEVEQAVLRYLALVDQVELEVRNSRRQFLQAQEVLNRIQSGRGLYGHSYCGHMAGYHRSASVHLSFVGSGRNRARLCGCAVKKTVPDSDAQYPCDHDCGYGFDPRL